MCVCMCVYLSQHFYALGENIQLSGYCLNIRELDFVSLNY